MTTPAKRTTVYLRTDLHEALRLKAAALSRTISELVSEAVKISLAEDAEDIAAFEETANEPLISYDEMVQRLKRSVKAGHRKDIYRR